MSDRIYDAIDHDFARRMRNWVRSLRGVPISITGVEYTDDRWRETRMPVLMGEAHDTDMALRALPGRYCQAVSQFWRNENESLRWHARRRGLGDPRTFETWVIRGHELLAVELEVRAALTRERYTAALLRP